MSRDIDDVYRRGKYKDEAFGDKRSISDDYTGDRIFRGNTGLINKHPVNKITDSDHVVSVSAAEKRYPDLSKDQQRSLVNDRSNIAHTNASLNREKGGMSNVAYVAQKMRDGEPLSAKTAANMVSRQLKSEINMGVKATGMRVENAFKKFEKK